MVPTLTEPSLQPTLECYLASAEAQPLTVLMIEIITFQLQERALFSNIDNFTNSHSSLN